METTAKGLAPFVVDLRYSRRGAGGTGLENGSAPPPVLVAGTEEQDADSLAAAAGQLVTSLVRSRLDSRPRQSEARRVRTRTVYADCRRAGAVERGREVGRERRLGLDPLAGERMVEGEPRGVQELALEAEVAGDAVDGVAGDRQLDRLEVDADLVRPPRLEPRPRAARAPSSSSTSNHVTASRGVGVSSEWRVRSMRSRPIGASIRPVRERGAPRTSAR